VYVHIMLKLLIFPLLLAAMLLSASCVRQDSRCTNLMGNGRYCLQPTTSMAPFEIQQKVEATIKNHHETMVTEIAVNAEGMQMIVLTPFGHQLVHVSYNNDEAKALVSPDSRLDPAMMIAMTQLALWPVDSVRKGLNSPLHLEESAGKRRYFTNDKLVLEVQYADAMVPANKFQLSLPSVELKLDIETLPEVEPRP
jgi:hypothetical protein